MSEVVKKDFDEILSNYVDRCISIIETNPSLTWIPLCSSFSKISNEDDTKDIRKCKNKNKNEVFLNFIDEISELSIFIKLLKKLKKIIKNPDTYKYSKGYQKFLDINKSLKKIEQELKK